MLYLLEIYYFTKTDVDNLIGNLENTGIYCEFWITVEIVFYYPFVPNFESPLVVLSVQLTIRVDLISSGGSDY